MPNTDGALGASIRRARKRRGLTMQQVAEISGVSISFISQVERNLVSPSVNSLQKISRALGMQIGGFFEDQGQAGRVIRAHERPRLIYPNRSEEEYLLLQAGDAITFDSHLPHSWRNISGKDCEALWVVTPPGY